MFINDCLNQYYQAEQPIIMIRFDLKDLANPLIQGDSTNDTTGTTEFIKDKLKDVLKPQSKLSKSLSTHNLIDQLKDLVLC